MEEIKDNTDIILNRKITESLFVKTNENFSDNMIADIRLKQKYKKEDIKTGKIAKIISFASISFMTLFAFLVAYLFYLKEYEVHSEFMSGYNEFFKNISFAITELTGIESAINYMFYSFLVIIMILMISVIDRFVLRKAGR